MDDKIQRMEQLVSELNEASKAYYNGLAEQMRGLREKNSAIDILYGQDLCHQVPAIVRYKQ